MSLSANQRRGALSVLVIGIMVGASIVISVARTPSNKTISSAASQKSPTVSGAPTSVPSDVASPSPTNVLIAPSTSTKPPAAVPTPSLPSAPSIVVPKGTSVTTATHGGKQTVTSKTNRVHVSVPTPRPTITIGWKPSDSLPKQGMIQDPSVNAPSIAADWTGYIAPSMSWDGWASCVRSNEKTLAPNGDGKTLTYTWTLTGRIKVTGGNYILLTPGTNESKKMVPSDVFFLYSILTVFADTMNPASTPLMTDIKAGIAAMPMNKDVSHSWDTRVTGFNETVTYSQGSCP